MTTKAQQLIQQKEKEIEEIRAKAFEQDIIDVLSRKTHTEEELYAVTSAFDTNYERKMRQANLVKARQAKQEKATPPAS